MHMHETSHPSSPFYIHTFTYNHPLLRPHPPLTISPSHTPTHSFNPKGHWVHEAAALLLDEFEREYERIVSKAERHVQVR